MDIAEARRSRDAHEVEMHASGLNMTALGSEREKRVGSTGFGKVADGEATVLVFIDNEGSLALVDPREGE